MEEREVGRQLKKICKNLGDEFWIYCGRERGGGGIDLKDLPKLTDTEFWLLCGIEKDVEEQVKRFAKAPDLWIQYGQGVYWKEEMKIYSDSQNHVYSSKFFLSQPLLQWKKGAGNLEKFIRVEQASEHKKNNFAQCKIKNF